MFQTLITRLAPDQAGALWIGALVFFLLLGNHERLKSRRNAALLGLLLVAPLFLEVLKWQWHPRSNWVFLAIYLVTAFYAIWAFMLGRRTFSIPWKPILGRRGLLLLLSGLLLMDGAAAFGRPPDDSGYYTNLGAQRLMETGRLPYADDLLKGPEAPGFGAAATYGPLLYLSHVPFQWLLGPEGNPADANPMDSSYVRPPHLATQAVTYLYFLAGVLALCLVVGKLAGPELGLSAGILYAASPYVIGLGGQEYLISGMTYLSHVAPPAVLMLALLAIPRPFVSGLLFAGSAGVLFYPVFMFPLWFGWWFWKKHGVVPFTAGCIVGGLLVTGFVVALTPGTADAGSISLFLESTLDHQEGVGDQRYGLSAFGFWGTHPRLASFWQVPLIGEGVLFKPIFMAFAALCAASFFLARGRSVPQLAALTAMLAAAVQLWKSHAAGTYVEWFLPFLIVALLGMGGRDPDPSTAEEGDA